MPEGIPIQAIIVSDNSVKSDNDYDIIYSNISFLNAQFKEYIMHSEVSVNALRSYYVDYYLAQVNNGGFSQFVYNSGWAQHVTQSVHDGLIAIGANGHIDLFYEATRILNQLQPEQLRTFFDGDYFGLENAERDFLNQFNDLFYNLANVEDLVILNAQWLRQHPDIVVLSIDEMYAELERRTLAIPDRDERIALALTNEPRYMKLIRALCKATDQELQRVTSGDPTYHFESQQVLAWHFITDRSRYYMVDIDDIAYMIEAESNQLIYQLSVTENYN